MPLPTRTLGRGGPQVTAIGFGLMSIGGIYGPRGSDEERLALLDRAYELGEWFWDTADVYLDSEDLIGKWIRNNPQKAKNIFLGTKFALELHSDGRQTINSDPEYVETACEKSLQRLGLETIDLYYCHRVDGKTPIEKTVQAMIELKNQGKIRYLGLSEVSAATLRRAHAVHPISAVQIEYSPFALDIEDPKTGFLQTCRELGVAVVAYSPMGRGLMTGRYKSHDDIASDPFLSVIPRLSKENFPRIIELVDKLKVVAARKGHTPGQLTMAWLMARGDDIIPIPGTRSIKYLEENLGTLNVRLSAAEKKEIADAIKKTELQGNRYPKGLPDCFAFGDTPAL